MTNSPSTATPAGLTRRGMLASAATAGLLYSFSVPIGGRAASAAGVPTSIGAFVRVSTDETVTIVVGASEMGQGVTSGIAQVLAEELMVDWTKVSVQTGQADAAYANPILRSQGTFGSFSMRGYFAAMRKAGATVREMLTLAAAQAMKVGVSSLTAIDGKVYITGTATCMTYGQLAASAALLMPPTAPALLGTGRYIGASLPRADIPVKVNGAAVFGLDVRLPGMVYAAIQNAPVVGATVPTGAYFATPSGALRVVPLDTAVAVIANDTYAAIRAARSLSVKWVVPGNNGSLSSDGILAEAQQLMNTGQILTAETTGSASGAFAAAAKTVDQVYVLPYLAHACMEVLNCTALVTATSCAIWAPTQAQSSVVASATALTGLPANAITVYTTYLGGGLGRKIEQDFIKQAIRIAQAMPGTPVKLTWSREQDFSADQYRPMALVRARAGLDLLGNVSAWWTRMVSPSYAYQHGGSTAVDFISMAGAAGLPYAFDSRQVEYIRHPAPVPVGSWRSIGCSVHTFVTETMIDDLATLAGADPLAFRLKLLAGRARAIAVLNAVAALANWNTPAPAGHARGLAFCFTDNSYVAQVIEVSQPTTGVMKVHSVACVVDCGFAVNPDGVTAQIEGGIVHGLSAALWGQVTITNGRPNLRNFDTYRMMRMRDMPTISVQLINGDPTSIGGAGEISVPPVAPAVSNAWTKLTGQRIRTLPMSKVLSGTAGGTTTGSGSTSGTGAGGTSGSGAGSTSGGSRNSGDGTRTRTGTRTGDDGSDD